MKLLLLIISLWMINFGFSQIQNDNKEINFFAQCILEINSNEDFNSLDAKIKENPNITTVRLDWNTKQLFLITKNMESFSEEIFLSWLMEYSEASKCINIGLLGVDPFVIYPNSNCK